MSIPRSVTKLVPAFKRRGDHSGIAGAGGRDLFLTQRGGTTALADWSSTSEELRRMQVSYAASFAVHMMSSMSLAGLDRSYGTLSEETDRVLRASEHEPESPNIVIDFALLHKIREADTSTLQLETDSPSQRLAAVGAAVLQTNSDVLRSFLASKKHAPTSAFEAVLGVTDPDERLRRIGTRIGDADRIVTASLQTYLALTLCDPYAYGMSSARAVHAFLASMLVRARLRNDGEVDESEWPLTELDRQIMLAPEIANIADDESGDPATLHAARAAIHRMPAFQGFMRCTLQHRAGAAHKTNPNFHAMYTILKATYIVHFAASWMQGVLMEQLERESTETEQEVAPSAPVLMLAPDSARVLEGRVEELRRAVATTLDTESAKANAYRTIVRCAHIVRRESERGVIDGRYSFSNMLAPVPKPAEHDKNVRDSHKSLYPQYQVNKAIEANASWWLVRNNAPVAWQYRDSLALPNAPQRHNTETMSMKLALDVTDGVSGDEIVQLAEAVRFYAQALLLEHRAIASGKDAQQMDDDDHCGPGGCVRYRMYKLRAPLLMLSRTYALLHRLYVSTGPMAAPKVPVIVTMIREAGWGSKDAVSNMRYTEAFAKQFSAFTLAMAHGTLYCHDSAADAGRTSNFGTYLQQLRDSNLTLMAMVQRRVLDTTPDCHPFRHGAATQLTLPVAVVAELLPSDRILPLDWTTAGILKAGGSEDASLRALLGDETFTKLRQEDSATIGLIQTIARGSGMDKMRAAMQAVAFSNLRG